MYPVLPLFPEQPKPEMMQSSPQYTVPPMQRMEVGWSSPRLMPQYGDDGTLLKIVLLVVLIIFTLWDVLMTTCNASTFIYLLQHPDLKVVMVVAYFATSFLFKMMAMILGGVVFMRDVKDSGLATPLYLSLAALAASGVGFVLFMMWSWSNLSQGTNIALVIDFLSYAATAVLSLVRWSSLKPNNFLFLPYPVSYSNLY